MEELLRQVHGYLRGMWRFRWWGLALTWVAGIAGCFMVYIMPDKYESSARVYVDTQSLLLRVVREQGVMPNVDQQVLILGKTLISRPNMEKLINMADLDFLVDTPAQREALVTHLVDKIQVRSSGRDNLYSMSYADSKPERAKRVVDSLVSLFVEKGMVENRDGAETTLRYLNEQIRVYEQKLAESEDRRKRFRLDNIDAVADEGAGGLIVKIASINSQVTEARLALNEAKQERDALYKQAKMGDDGVWVPEFDGRIDNVKRALDELRLRYTDNHPEVREAQRMLEELQKQRQGWIDEGRTSDPGAANPAVIQLRMELGKADAKVAAAQAKLQDFEARLNAARDSARRQTEVETQLQQLDRDYDINKKQYGSFVQKREEVLAGRGNGLSEVIDFRVVDPANMPQAPSAPNRLMLMPLVGLLALAAGAALTFLISQLKPSFIDAHTLRDVLGLPVLGIVSMLVTPERKRKRVQGLFTFGCGVAGFVVSIGLATVALTILQG
ncbi:MAG: chain length-determining protein [Azoarcus sp.]|jgi:polysaccharide chain length determinant protein (PEP-CTERM system associated)|nr:chain length-determining protein [Azoarcus sp.]